MIRGENNCAQHRSKAQHWTQTKGKQHPRCFAKAQGTTSEKEVLLNVTFGHFSCTRSAHDSDQQNKNCTTHIPEEIKQNKEVITSKFETDSTLSGSMTTANGKVLFFPWLNAFFLFMLDLRNCIKYVLYTKTGVSK